MTGIVVFPDNPTYGQVWVAENAVTYMWLGDRWSSAEPMSQGIVEYYRDGGRAGTDAFDDVLDGGDVYKLGFYVTQAAINLWGSAEITYSRSDGNALGTTTEQGIIISQPGLCNLITGSYYCGGGDSTATYFPLTAHPNAIDCLDDPLSDVKDGTFTQTIYTWNFSDQDVEIRAYAIIDGSYYYSPIVTAHIDYIPCFGAGTQITLADGSKKAIEEIGYDDELRVWNFDEGHVDHAKPIWIKRAQSSPAYNLSKFSDGTELRTLQVVRGHRVFNRTQSKFQFIGECNIGDVIVKDNGVDVTLDSVEHVIAPVVYYNVITDHHMNLYANDILTSTGFNNLYTIQDMRFVKEDRPVRTYKGIPEYFVTGLRLAENTTTDVVAMTRHLKQLDKLKETNPAPISITIPPLHWKRDRPDSRDHLFAAPAGQQLLPAIDLRQWSSAIEDQGALGSCTGNSIAAAIELIDRKNSKNLDVSRLFIYYYERVFEGTVNYDAGAYIRDGLKAVNRYGAPLEVYWPYIINRFATRPNNTAIADAAKRKVSGYQRCTNFTAVKSALAARQPVVIGFDVYESFYNIGADGVMTYPNISTEQLLGGHAVCLVGYNDATQKFIAKNSWGSSWGDGGYFYMPYTVIQDTSMSSDFWTISSVKNP